MIGNTNTYMFVETVPQYKAPYDKIVALRSDIADQPLFHGMVSVRTGPVDDNHEFHNGLKKGFVTDCEQSLWKALLVIDE